jgi:hypothetical protein
MRIGMAELVVILVIVVSWAVPIGAAVWALVMLKRIREGQQNVEMKLEAIAALLRRS